MTQLSVNLNKIALLRNTRFTGIPSVLEAAQTCVRAGAHGVTVHPRPDERLPHRAVRGAERSVSKAASGGERNRRGRRVVPTPPLMYICVPPRMKSPRS